MKNLTQNILSRNLVEKRIIFTDENSETHEGRFTKKLKFAEQKIAIWEEHLNIEEPQKKNAGTKCPEYFQN